MPKLIRNVQKAELVRMCQSHLKSIKEYVPCEVTLFKILDDLPAATARVMRGINPNQEEAMTSFGVLIDITKQLVNFGLKEESSRMIITSINSAHSYIRSRFHYNLEMHSPIKSHCVTYACSDASELFGDTCEVEHTQVRSRIKFRGCSPCRFSELS